MKTTPGIKLNEVMDLSEEDRKFLHGGQNWLIRMYFYLENGLNILNEFRNWFLGVAALYLALKLEANSHGLLIISAVALPSLVALVILGKYNVHTLSKMKEWLSVRFSSHYSLRNFNYQEQQAELLREIRDILREQRREIDLSKKP